LLAVAVGVPVEVAEELLLDELLLDMLLDEFVLEFENVKACQGTNTWLPEAALLLELLFAAAVGVPVEVAEELLLDELLLEEELLDEEPFEVVTTT